MQLFDAPQEYPEENIIEMPCTWKIQEALNGTEPCYRELQRKMKDDGATKEALDDAWIYGMGCESATIGGIYTGHHKAENRMGFGHYVTWPHDGDRMWRVVVNVINDSISTCYPT